MKTFLFYKPRLPSAASKKSLTYEPNLTLDKENINHSVEFEHTESRPRSRSPEFLNKNVNVSAKKGHKASKSIAFSHSNSMREELPKNKGTSSNFASPEKLMSMDLNRMQELGSDKFSRMNLSNMHASQNNIRNLESIYHDYMGKLETSAHSSSMLSMKSPPSQKSLNKSNDVSMLSTVQLALRKDINVEELKVSQKKIGCAHSGNVMYCSICNRKASMKKINTILKIKK